MSVRAMAAALGVGKSQVQRDAAAGMPMHDVAAARAWRVQHHDVSRTAEGRVDRPLADPATAIDAAPAVDGAESEPRPDDTAEYRFARTRREQIRQEREQIELEQMRGSVIALVDAKRLVFTAFRSLRDAVLNVPARVKDQCTASTDSMQVERIIEDELAKALGTFAVEKVLSEQDEDSDAAD